MDDEPLRIDVFSDVACPWCFVGKRRMEAAVAQDGRPVVVRWRAFQLDPTVPAEGLPAREYFAKRFGSLERARELQARMVETGREVGIAFDYDSMPKGPNTRLAHRAIALAGESGPEAQDAAVEALFRAYFEQARDITDVDVVAEAAGVGADALRAEAGAEQVDADLRFARGVIQAVPFFIADGRYGLPGAQPAEIFLRFLAHAREERSRAA